MSKLMRVLEQWQDDLDNEYMDERQQILFRDELWQIAEQFEIEIRKENKGWELERAQIHHFYQNRERKIKEQYLF